MPKKEKSLTSIEISSVSSRVLDRFIDKLASEEEYSQVAARLKAILFNDPVSEKSLQMALFGEDES